MHCVYCVLQHVELTRLSHFIQDDSVTSQSNLRDTPLSNQGTTPLSNQRTTPRSTQRATPLSKWRTTPLSNQETLPLSDGDKSSVKSFHSDSSGHPVEDFRLSRRSHHELVRTLESKNNEVAMMAKRIQSLEVCGSGSGSGSGSESESGSGNGYGSGGRTLVVV